MATAQHGDAVGQGLGDVVLEDLRLAVDLVRLRLLAGRSYRP